MRSAERYERAIEHFLNLMSYGYRGTVRVLQLGHTLKS